jgi:hypothetical protein
MKKIVYTTMVALLLVACSKESDDTGSGTGGGGESGGVTEVTPVTSDLTVNLTTDKACYRPGESVSFTADALPAGAKIRYRTMDKVVSEQAAVGTTWTWTAPATDYTGYLVADFSSGRKGVSCKRNTLARPVTCLVGSEIDRQVRGDWGYFRNPSTLSASTGTATGIITLLAACNQQQGYHCCINYLLHLL